MKAVTTPTHHRAPSRRQRKGFVLPLVIVATLLVAALASAAQFAAWRATRAARQAFNGERALLGADESIARTVANWNAESFAGSPIGSRITAAVLTTAGEPVDVIVTRTAPLIAWIDVSATSHRDGAPTRAHRRVGRALFAEPPPLPLNAALVAITPVALRGTARISGIDSVTLNDECGPWRDTTSIAGLYSSVHHIDSTVVIAGVPSIATPVDPPRDVTAFNDAWQRITARAVHRQTTTNAPLPNEPPWRALVLHDTTTIQLAGASRHDGLVAFDGNLVLRGTLTVRGLMIVRGAVDATAGQLDINGALVIYAPTGATSRFGNNATVRYSQCALRRALAAVARPDPHPFRVWSERD